MSGMKPLFEKHDASAVFGAQRRAIEDRIQKESRHYVLNVDIQEYVNFIVSERGITPIVLYPDRMQMDHYDTLVDRRYVRNIGPSLRGESAKVPGKVFTFSVPFTGDSGLFDVQPSSHYMNHPYAQVNLETIEFEARSGRHYDPADIRRAFDRELDLAQKYIAHLTEDVDRFNQELPKFVEQALLSRREAILEDERKLNEIGIPRRTDPIATYSVPLETRKEVVPPPQVTREIRNPDPVLALAQYDEIVKTIYDATLVLERSPRTFHDFEEEQVRDILLVLLNNQYIGTVTGETFNGKGKTDILIRHEGSTLFIGECKIWTGPKSLKRAVDQLLGYVTWRDTKAAIIVFDKRGQLTRILDRIPGVMAGHPNFKQDLGPVGEAGYRSILRQRDDPARDLMVTVLAFTVPNPDPNAEPEPEEEE